MKFTPTLVDSCRRQFPALSRQIGERPAVFFDGPGGTQVPERVIAAVSGCLANTNANHGGLFATSRESDALLAQAHQAVADFLGSDDPDSVIFGQNMTSLTFALSRALSKTWRPGDEVIVTRLDHDANVSPWVLAARDAGAAVRFVPLRPEDGTLDLAALKQLLSLRTKLVAVGCASNATGTVNPVREIAQWAHEIGALVFLDAVHYAPHALIDVQSLDCDFLACSAYKFFGPHVGILWGRRQLLEELEAYKVRPAVNTLPDKWMTGTQSHEAIVGAMAAVDYLADLGRTLAGNESLSRRAALVEAYREIDVYERTLVTRMLKGLAEIPEVKVWGITELSRINERVATVSFTHQRFTASQMAKRLAAAGFFTWHGNYYALNFTEAMGLEPEGMLRVGMVHYNTIEEVERFIGASRQL
ncbi:MAG TPA: cysteine desulfurase-like protein [Pirellulaceae bacterium]|jgi:cysteine desulfurase family protein (TIGR01976 family)